MGESKISWASWKDACRDKSIGGLGINDMILVNPVISGKWHWSLIYVGTCMWKDIVYVR